jgi:hypothetical protein
MVEETSESKSFTKILRDFMFINNAVKINFNKKLKNLKINIFFLIFINLFFSFKLFLMNINMLLWIFWEEIYLIRMKIKMKVN